MRKIVDGVELLRMIKNNEFEDGDEIRPDITVNQVYKYSAYHRNFVNKNTGNALKVTDYIFWTFEILSEETKKINIQAIKELSRNCFIETNFKYAGELVCNTLNELIKAVKQLDKKIGEE